MTTIQYLSLTKSQRFVVNVGNFFKNFGKGFVNFFRGLPLKFMRLGYKIAAPFVTLIDAWKKGSWMVRMNFGIFGFYQITHREIARGVLYLLYDIVFIWFLAKMGIPYLAKLGTLWRTRARSCSSPKRRSAASTRRRPTCRRPSPITSSPCAAISSSTIRSPRSGRPPATGLRTPRRNWSRSIRKD